MTNADLELVGDGPGVFAFYERECMNQLTTDYSKTTPLQDLSLIWLITRISPQASLS